MKMLFNWSIGRLGMITAAVSLTGCLGFDTDDDGVDTDLEAVFGPSEPHGLEGEVVLFVNSRLTKEGVQRHVDLPGGQDGEFVGNELWLYDPDLDCGDGSTDCRLARLGFLQLDAEHMGDVSVQDGSLARYQILDLAWHPTQGLYGLGYDPKNDEWSVATLDVPDWTSTGNRIGIERYTFSWDDPDSPATDPCYWQNGMSALGFVGDELYAGSQGKGGVGLDPAGMAFRIDTEVLREGHCVNPRDTSQDPKYYACGNLCEPACVYASLTGIAGDISASATGGLISSVSSEDETVMPLDLNELFACDPNASQPAQADGLQIQFTGLEPGEVIDGLARVGDKLYGLDVQGVVYEIDDTKGTIAVHDDVSTPVNAVAANGLRLRGATRVVLP